MHTNDMIEFILTYDKETERAVEEKRLDPNVPKAAGGGGHTRISDPTAIKALRNVSEVECVVVCYGKGLSRTVYKPERWLDVSRATKGWYKNKLQAKIIEHRFKDEPDERKEVCKELGMTPSYYSSMLRDVFEFATAYAGGKGLIKLNS